MRKEFRRKTQKLSFNFFAIEVALKYKDIKNIAYALFAIELASWNTKKIWAVINTLFTIWIGCKNWS